MMTVADLFEASFIKMKKRTWDCFYVAVDIHGTMIKPNYSNGPIPTEFYPYAVYCLQMLSRMKCVKLILYTCSYPHEIEKYNELFEGLDIHFDYVNENPEIVSDNNLYGFYDQKFYRNITLDDTAGFEPGTDWCFLCYTMMKMYEKVFDCKPEMKNNETDTEGFNFEPKAHIDS